MENDSNRNRAESAFPVEDLSSSRRRILKLLGVSALSVAASNVLPSRWESPFFSFGVLPLHAQTSGEETSGEETGSDTLTYTLTVTSVFPAGGSCATEGISQEVNGTVTASDGSDMTGVQVNLRFTDIPDSGSYFETVVTVLPGNTFSYTGIIVDADDGSWSSPSTEVAATFVDQASYGTASATSTNICGGGG